ncbi:MAG: hypothetical protein J2P20_09875, partial [Pseudonocardia sp.]|nr:hypothetical protein [Pseudonocardia sp.]
MPPQPATATGTTTTARRNARPARPGRAGEAKKRRRGEGQWALGYREPLNANERSKRDDDP